MCTMFFLCNVTINILYGYLSCDVTFLIMSNTILLLTYMNKTNNNDVLSYKTNPNI